MAEILAFRISLATAMRPRLRLATHCLMNITIFGASGRTGKALAVQALAQGHQVTAHLRSEARGDALPAKLRKVTGAIDDPAVLADALVGADAVISALGTTIRKRNTVLSDITRGVVAAMEEAGVKRFVCISSLGVGDSYAQVTGFFMRTLIKTLGKEIWADKLRQEQVIAASSVDYVIVRPGGLTDKYGSGSWRAIDASENVQGTQMIPREDVAAFCLKEAAQPSLSRKTITLLAR